MRHFQALAEDINEISMSISIPVFLIVFPGQRFRVIK